MEGKEKPGGWLKSIERGLRNYGPGGKDSHRVVNWVEKNLLRPISQPFSGPKDGMMEGGQTLEDFDFGREPDGSENYKNYWDPMRSLTPPGSPGPGRPPFVFDPDEPGPIDPSMMKSLPDAELLETVPANTKTDRLGGPVKGGMDKYVKTGAGELRRSVDPKDLMKALAVLGVLGGTGGATFGGISNSLQGKSIGRGMLTGGLTGAGAGIGAGAGSLGGILGTEAAIDTGLLHPNLTGTAGILGGNVLAAGGGTGVGGYAGYQLAQKLMGLDEEDEKQGHEKVAQRALSKYLKPAAVVGGLGVLGGVAYDGYQADSSTLAGPDPKETRDAGAYGPRRPVSGAQAKSINDLFGGSE